eukprot:153129_1
MGQCTSTPSERHPYETIPTTESSNDNRDHMITAKKEINEEQHFTITEEKKQQLTDTDPLMSINKQMDHIELLLLSLQSNNLTKQQNHRLQTLKNLMTTQPQSQIPAEQTFKLTWIHIGNAMAHELYPQIQSTLMAIVKKHNLKDKDIYNPKTVNMVLDKIKEKRNVDNQEISYISKLIARATSFQYKSQRMMHEVNHTKIGESHNEEDQLSVNTLYDIYSVHNIFLFTNYHFQSYHTDEFIANIAGNKYFSDKEVELLSNIKNASIPTMYLYPSYVIDDDMYLIWNYFFATSYLTHKLKQLKQMLTVKIFVIPKRICCIYDEQMILKPLNGLSVDEYLISKGIRSFQRTILSSTYDEKSLGTILERHINSGLLTMNNPRMKYVVFIVDRQKHYGNDFDLLYFYGSNSSDVITDCPMNGNYIISSQFEIQNDAVKCHLYYGANVADNIRFYPEYLTTFIPRLFKRDENFTDYEKVEKLYSSKFKHAFAVNLQDDKFDKYYKRITGWTHISVNYNRDIVLSDNDDAKLDEKSKEIDVGFNEQCNVNDILELYNCPFVEYIVKSLIKYKANKYTNIDTNMVDVKLLSKSYSHIINTHLFCLNKDKRKDIKNYVCKLVGECSLGDKCPNVRQHCVNRRAKDTENIIMTNKKQISATQRVLISYLISLHVYLLHDGEELYRIKRFDDEKEQYCIPAKARFTTEVHTVEDKIDGCIKFIQSKDDDDAVFVKEFVHWIDKEQYDWDSLVADLESKGTKAKQSNIYLFMHSFNKETLFDILHDKYINIYDYNVNAINFGVSVLEWFDEDVIPAHKTFVDEILNYPELTNKSVEHYKRFCEIMTAYNGNKYKFHELLSLKLYTDESALCSRFRSSFWSTKSIELKRQFYWFATNMYKACLYHALPIPRFTEFDTNPLPLYHGLDTIFAIDSTTPKYHGPVSTTANSSSAAQFADETGLIWKMETTYYSPFNFIIGIDVSFISQYKHESEILLNDSYLYISSTHNYVRSVQDAADHLLYQLQIFKEKVTDPIIFWKRIGFELEDMNNDNMLTTIIKNHPLLFQTTQYDAAKTVVHRLVEELKIMQLLNVYRIFASTLQCVALYKEFKYADYKLQPNTNYDKMNILDDEKDQFVRNTKIALVFDINVPDQFTFNNNAVHLSLFQNKTCTLYFQNKEICDGKRIVIRKLSVNMPIMNETEPISFDCKFINNYIINLKYKVYVNKMSVPSLQLLVIVQTVHQPFVKTQIQPHELDSKHHVYIMSATNTIQLIIPYKINARSVSIYVRPLKGSMESNYTLIKTINIKQHGNDGTTHKINYLIAVLKELKHHIDDQAIFSRKIGFDVTSSRDTFSQLISDEYQTKKKFSSLMVNCEFRIMYAKKMRISKKTILQRLVEELNINPFPQHYLLLTSLLSRVDIFRLKIKAKNVAKQNNFFNNTRYQLRGPGMNINFGYNDFLLNNHMGTYDLFLQNVELFGKDFILIQTVNLRSQIEEFIRALYVVDSNYIKVRDDFYDYTVGGEFSQYRFTTSKLNMLNDNIWDHKEDVYSETFQDISKFRMQMALSLCATHLYVAPVNEHFSSAVKIKSFLPSKFESKRDEPFKINNRVNVNKFDSEHLALGTIEIVSQGTLVIENTGHINGNEAGLDMKFFYVCRRDETQKTNEEKHDFMILKHGGFIVDDDNKEEQKDGYGGGIIYLESKKGNIIIHRGGQITANSTNEKLSGGTIMIYTENKFQNNGIINANKGQIFIYCKEFENNGEIHPPPKVNTKCFKPSIEIIKYERHKQFGYMDLPKEWPYLDPDISMLTET